MSTGRAGYRPGTVLSKEPAGLLSLPRIGAIRSWRSFNWTGYLLINLPRHGLTNTDKETYLHDYTNSVCHSALRLGLIYKVCARNSEIVRSTLNCGGESPGVVRAS